MGQRVTHENRLPRGLPTGPHYFTELTISKAILYLVIVVYVVSASLVSVLEPFLTIPCDNPGEKLEFGNPAYDGTRCPHMRHAMLMGLTSQDCSFARRLVTSVVFGGIIGWERRQADRPAGIRTMSLVSLGSCLFTINSAFAFMDGPMAWDASRVSAAIPSGVGFLGAGLIFKKQEKNASGDSSHVVHGLTTAASLWLSAAVGIACGGELYFAASFGTAMMMLLLRFGPRGLEESGEDESNEEPPGVVTTGEKSMSYASFALTSPDQGCELSETASLTRKSYQEKKIIRRRQAALASMV
jgi:putative Mg2+ transporter-C (MgtC) family protein